jgi:hypothetical protein
MGLSSSGPDNLWQPLDIYSSPSRSFNSQQNKYDSDDQSSMLSEPGSPQVLSADEEDVDMMSEDSDSAAYSQPRARSPSFNSSPLHAPWKTRNRSANRVATPMMPARPKTSPIQTHIRRRHPQENVGGERLDVPSPIDEDEVPTPPSAAEAAGSQLELLTVSDVEMQGVEHGDSLADGIEHLPQVAVSQSQSTISQMPNSSFANGPGSMMVRKQRQRSGALSAAGYGSPMRGASLDGSNMVTTDTGDANVGGNKRGISMGYRPDCEKCRLKVPGHMNHFF